MRIFLCLFLLLFAGMGVAVNYAQPACPECYFNQSHLTGQGNIGSRLLLNIYIDSSWNVDPQGNSTPFQTTSISGTVSSAALMAVDQAELI